MKMLIIRWLLTLVCAFLIGRLMTKIHMPSILGWLIAGMALGPHALAWMPQTILDSNWYNWIQDILSVGVGLMLGTEMNA